MESNMESVKSNIKIVWKESAKFALLGIVSLFSIGLLSGYILIYILKIDMEISALISGTITAITIFIIDEKKIHSVRKINDAHSKIFKIIIKKWIIKRR